jgi:protoheme IX farnesyltransferase
MNLIKTLLELVKIRITFAVMFTTIAGYVLYYQGFSTHMLLSVVGILLLACGSAALNHIQEFKYDALMERTRNRPIPSGRISLLMAWVIVLVLSVSGSYLIYAGSNLTGMLLGLSAMFWYNIIYTYLKRYTAYAVIPGSVIGAIPPLVGWVAAGGSLQNPYAVLIAIFFFIWQVPHFWLLLMKYGAQYEVVGFPVITKVYTRRMIYGFTFVWVLATAIIAFMLPYFGVLHSYISAFGILFSSIWLVYQFSRLYSKHETEFNPKKYFLRLNFYILFIVVLMVTDHWLI